MELLGCCYGGARCCYGVARWLLATPEHKIVLIYTILKCTLNVTSKCGINIYSGEITYEIALEIFHQTWSIPQGNLNQSFGTFK